MGMPIARAVLIVGCCAQRNAGSIIATSWYFITSSAGEPCR
jgi:hypothetical protein